MHRILFCILQPASFLEFRNELSIFVMRFLIDLQPNLWKICFFFFIVSFSRWNLFILYTALLHTNMEMKRNCLFALPILFVLYLDCHQQRILFGFRRILPSDIMSNGKKTKLSILISKVRKIMYHTKWSYLHRSYII